MSIDKNDTDKKDQAGQLTSTEKKNTAEVKKQDFQDSLKTALDQANSSIHSARALQNSALNLSYQNAFKSNIGSAIAANSALVQNAMLKSVLGTTNKIKSLDFGQDIRDAISGRENLRGEINKLHDKYSASLVELENAAKKGKVSEKKNSELEALVKELRKKEDLGFLLNRVGPAAQKKLLDDAEFRQHFSEDESCDAFVMSVDIRRSTELMLKARTPSLFAEFISRVTAELYECIVANNGVFDKFTGDGVLAFFPRTFSGPDYAYSVIKAASECHQRFERIYRESRNSFSSVLKDIGLGIGVDFGSVRLLRVAEGLTVVGVPVVYACRLSGAPAGKTLVNQPAFELIQENYASACKIEELSLEIKHEGNVIAYDISLSHIHFEPRKPLWM